GVGKLGSGCATVASGDEPVIANSGAIGCTFAVSHVFCRQPRPNELSIVLSSEKWLYALLSCSPRGPWFVTTIAATWPPPGLTPQHPALSSPSSKTTTRALLPWLQNDALVTSLTSLPRYASPIPTRCWS